MGRYEIKIQSKGKSEEFCDVAWKATCFLKDSDMLDMPGETGDGSEE